MAGAQVSFICLFNQTVFEIDMVSGAFPLALMGGWTEMVMWKACVRDVLIICSTSHRYPHF